MPTFCDTISVVMFFFWACGGDGAEMFMPPVDGNIAEGIILDGDIFSDGTLTDGEFDGVSEQDMRIIDDLCDECEDLGQCLILTCDSAIGVCDYFFLDIDGDGHSPDICSEMGGDDCDDTPPCDPDEDEDCEWEDRFGGSRTYPGAPEICDGQDNNCNKEIDEDCVPEDK